MSNSVQSFSPLSPSVTNSQPSVTTQSAATQSLHSALEELDSTVMPMRRAGDANTPENKQIRAGLRANVEDAYRSAQEDGVPQKLIGGMVNQSRDERASLRVSLNLRRGGSVNDAMNRKLMTEAYQGFLAHRPHLSDSESSRLEFADHFQADLLGHGVGVQHAEQLRQNFLEQPSAFRIGNMYSKF